MVNHHCICNVVSGLFVVIFAFRLHGKTNETLDDGQNEKNRKSCHILEIGFFRGGGGTESCIVI
jgi:hypothetical protein